MLKIGKQEAKIMPTVFRFEHSDSETNTQEFQRLLCLTIVPFSRCFRQIFKRVRGAQDLEASEGIITQDPNEQVLEEVFFGSKILGYIREWSADF